MKKLIILSAVLSCFTNSAYAEDQAPINSSATVIAGCSFINKAENVNFGSQKYQTGMAELKQLVTLNFECSNGTQATIYNVAAAGGYKLTSAQGENISVLLTNENESVFYGSRQIVHQAVGIGYGSVNPLNFKFKIKIPPTNFGGVSAGLYTGTFVFDVVN